MGRGEESEGGLPTVRTTVPQPPRPFELPRTPLPHKRVQTGQFGVELRPLAEPSIPLPANEDEDFLQRFAVWHQITNGSLPEYIAWEFLVFQKKMEPGIDFVFQNPILGGRTEFGGFVLDYFFPATRMGWRVQGERFHLLQSKDRARDDVAEATLVSRGVSPVIDLWEDDLLTRPIRVLEMALRGQEVTERAPK